MPTLKKKAVKGKSLGEFRNIHDESTVVPGKIKQALKELGNSWEYESDFITRAGLNTTKLARYREQFQEFWTLTNGRNSKRVYAGTKALATKLREMA